MNIYANRFSNYLSVDLRNKTIQAMNYITKTTPCVKFVPFNLANPNPNHVTIYPGTECKSELGMRGGNQAIFFNSRCFLKGLTTPVHELMHTLGFVHEHNRTLVLVKMAIYCPQGSGTLRQQLK